MLLMEYTPLLHALAERLLEKEVVEGAEVTEMLKAYKEVRSFPPVQESMAANHSPSSETTMAKERPRAAAEESHPLPGLQPKPSLA